METVLYDQDFYAWAKRNAELLRQGRTSEVDTEHIAEELESMTRSEKRELVNRLAILMVHLLKWQVQATRLAAAETGMNREAFPDVCPYSVDQVLAAGFWPQQEAPR